MQGFDNKEGRSNQENKQQTVFKTIRLITKTIVTLFNPHKKGLSLSDFLNWEKQNCFKLEKLILNLLFY